jgi:hypothetical protein
MVRLMCPHPRPAFDRAFVQINGPIAAKQASEKPLRRPQAK